MLASLAAVGAEARFYPVGEPFVGEDRDFDGLGERDVRAVVVVNYFGFPQLLARFVGWCRERGAALIEDNAHGFLSCDGDTPLGHRGDLGIFSLRKTLALPNGAALVDNGPFAGRRPPHARYAESARGSEARYRCKAALRRAVAISGLTGARTIIGAVRVARWMLTGSVLPRPSLDAERGLPQVAFAPLAIRLLKQCDLAHESERRRRLYRRCAELFQGQRGVRPLFGRLGDGVVPWGFPLLCTEDDPGAVIAAWWRRGVPMIQWPHLPAAIAATAPAHYRRVVVVPFLW